MDVLLQSLSSFFFQVIAHYKKIQDYDDTFYRQFGVVVCGLDSIVARRWINGMLVRLVEID